MTRSDEAQIQGYEWSQNNKDAPARFREERRGDIAGEFCVRPTDGAERWKLILRLFSKRSGLMVTPLDLAARVYGVINKYRTGQRSSLWADSQSKRPTGCLMTPAISAGVG